MTNPLKDIGDGLVVGLPNAKGERTVSEATTGKTLALITATDDEIDSDKVPALDRVRAPYKAADPLTKVREAAAAAATANPKKSKTGSRTRKSNKTKAAK